MTKIETVKSSKKLSRADFLRGGFTSSTQPIRPPWAVSENIFIDICQRSNDCIQACPENIIVKSNGGFPSIDFNLGECTFCKRCLENCPTGALALPYDSSETIPSPWHLNVEISTTCLSSKKIECQICIDQCEPEALQMKPAIGGPVAPTINQNLCTGCGACVRPCPVNAIKIVQQ